MLMLAEPSLGEDEKAALAEVVDCGWITMGDRVRAFEEAFARKHGADEAVAVSSCTAGLHLLMEALGLGPGDEVLVPSLTFVATANAVLYVGATPVFVDIRSLDVPHICPADADAKCTPRTRAIVVMHYAGYQVDPEPWRALAHRRGLLLIEDAAHGPGSLPGSCGMPMLGDAAAYSFYSNKNMTTAEGGMVTAADPAVLDRVRQLRSHGMTTNVRRHSSGAPNGYDVTMLGYNYRMDELRAAIGLVQLERLDAWNEKRRLLTAAYRLALAEHCPSVAMPFSNFRPSSYHILPVVLPTGCDRQAIMADLHQSGIQSTVHYPPVHQLSLYRHRSPEISLERTEEFSSRELTLPLHPKMDEDQVMVVVRALALAMGRKSQLLEGACR